MTKKEAILITNILKTITIKANQEPKSITFNEANINDTYEYLIILEKITRRAYQKAKMSMSKEQIECIKKTLIADIKHY